MRRDGLYCAIVVALIIACLTAASEPPRRRGAV